MILGNILRVALRSMVAHKMRLVLTMLGIIIGCGAVIAMLALGEGARAAVTAQFEGMGTNLLVLHNHWGRARRQMLSVDEWHLMERQTRYVSMVAPEMDQDLIVRYENKNQESEVFGTTPQYFQVRNIELEAGRIFEELESQTGARVCVIGAEVAAELFEGSDPMHQEIYLGDTSVRVIGLLKAKGGPDSVDEKIIVPMTLAMQRIIGQDHLDAINITVRSHDMVQEAEAALIHALREFRGLTPGEEDNFRFFSQTEVLEEINRSIGMFKALLGGVAAVSLLVGGIGIMNIMLVTVTERTREIGIRKALGARRRDIMTQFLIESVVVACIGGALGIALGWGIAAVFDKFVEQFETLVTPASVILAVSCSTAIGLIFGIYPARRASKLDPIEALRYE